MVFLTIIFVSLYEALMTCFAELVKKNECTVVDTEKKLKDE